MVHLIYLFLPNKIFFWIKQKFIMHTFIDLNRLEPGTFWDCKIEELDAEKDLNFIVFRILKRGSEIEFNLKSASKHLLRSQISSNQLINH